MPAVLRHRAAAMRHSITELFRESVRLMRTGVTMEDHMVTDLVSWLIVASGIAVVVCGCIFTKPRTASTPSTETFERTLDRAA